VRYRTGETIMSNVTEVPPNMLTTRQVAALLGISERTLWTLTKSGRIRATRFNRRVLYTPASVQQFIDSNTAGIGSA
jgi:excisionase family DNA binding protein